MSHNILHRKIIFDLIYLWFSCFCFVLSFFCSYISRNRTLIGALVNSSIMSSVQRRWFDPWHFFTPLHCCCGDDLVNIHTVLGQQFIANCYARNRITNLWKISVLISISRFAQFLFCGKRWRGGGGKRASQQCNWDKTSLHAMFNNY